MSGISSSPSIHRRWKKVLTVSFNPSSTYLYSIDEGALFNGLLNTIAQFAEENKFDLITSSQNHTIRTNRTGGQFEKAVEKINKTFRFAQPKVFSYSPHYSIQDMDVLWEREHNPAPIN